MRAAGAGSARGGAGLGGRRGGADHVEGVGVKFSQIDQAHLKVIVDYVNRVARVLYSASE